MDQGLPSPRSLLPTHNWSAFRHEGKEVSLKGNLEVPLSVYDFGAITRLVYKVRMWTT